ncbi:ELMO/CED-12 family-domain-containing protein [Pterulicium gracile]|uniref:ELMO/CED-12 family-domain-containing protein n=1 Tax=Pterulicium gracile TaxID=1884261 RepID=A0A5C3QTN9_9AGAR|nr:ELMO/CED-12 family-domain-containing protein [Pterula gracilis]
MTATASFQSNGTHARAQLVPTNSVRTMSGVTVKARIDPTLTVDDVVRQLCINLKISDPHGNFALREETDELVTNDNMRKKIKSKANLKLVNAPFIEAKQTAEKLTSRDDRTLKLTLFSLQRYIREEQFANPFLEYDGLARLLDIICTAHGNTLAYALTALQNLMDLDYGWSTLDDAFIFKVVQILSSPSSLINVCRPATAILKKLVEADPLSSPGPVLASSSKGLASAVEGSVYRYGFSVVFEQMRKEERLLETVVSRLGSQETAMGQYSMMLINSLLAHASDERWEEFFARLERLNTRKAVIGLMSSHTSEDLTSCILDFQANFIRVIFRRKTSYVEPLEPSHYALLDVIWEGSGMHEEHDDETGEMIKWRKLGFDTEDIQEEFNESGLLGLECFYQFVQHDRDYFSKVIVEQVGRPKERRCPIAKASNEVVELLSEHWAIFAPGYSTSTAFQPFLLNFYKVHHLATEFFIRMWNESLSTAGDFTRVVALVRSQLKVTLRSENSREWHEVEHDFQEGYKSVRERQMKELEMDDDLLSKLPIRNLREKLYKESFEFVRQQRVHCLLQGAWFVNAVPPTSSHNREPARRPTRSWRFLRLDNGLRYLHYVDSAAKFQIRSGLEDLTESIEISQISEIATGTCAQPPNLLGDQNNDLPVTLLPSALSFSLINAHGDSMADQIAPDASRWADWTDGLNMLRRDGGHVASRETAGFVQALTEIGLKIKLLDLTGEMVEIPSGLVAGPPPPHSDFHFSEL